MVNQYQNYNGARRVTPEDHIARIEAACSWLPSFIEQWEEIDMAYHRFNWTDTITDSERINEYQKINEKYKWYISNKRDEIMDGLSNPEKLSKDLLSMIASVPNRNQNEYDRVYITYIYLRNNLLLKIVQEVDSLVLLGKELERGE